MKDIPAMWDYKTGKWIIRFTNPVTGEVEEAIDKSLIKARELVRRILSNT